MKVESLTPQIGDLTVERSLKLLNMFFIVDVSGSMVTDGEPTPRDDYQPALERLKENAWSQNAQRFAVLIGRDTVNSPSARKAVAGFVSDEDEGIIDAADACDIAATVQANTLKQIIAETLHPVKKAVENEETETDSSGGFGDFGGFGSFDDYDDGSDEPPTFGGKYDR